MIVLFTSLLKLGITFPFLIGKVLTEVHTVNARRRFKFPFLIGKVLTMFDLHGKYETAKVFVSIPYR